MAGDEPTVVPVDAHLWRRVPEWHWVDDGKGGKRPSSAAYEDDPDGSPTSVTIAEESTISRCLDPVRALPKLFAVAEFPSQAARDKKLTVRRDPTEEEPAHALMTGNKTKSVRNHLVRNSTWAHEPNAPYPAPEPSSEPPEAPEPASGDGDADLDGVADAPSSDPESASDAPLAEAQGQSAAGLGTAGVVVAGVGVFIGLVALAAWFLA